jgi:hypothetical protein
MVFRNRSISQEVQSIESHLIKFVALVKIKLDIDFKIFSLLNIQHRVKIKLDIDFEFFRIYLIILVH